MTQKIAEHHAIREGLSFLSSSLIYCGAAKYLGIHKCSMLTQGAAFSAAALAQGVLSSCIPCGRPLCAECRGEEIQEGFSFSLALYIISPFILSGLVGRYCRFTSPLISTALVSAGYFGISLNSLTYLEDTVKELSLSFDAFQKLCEENHFPAIPITINENVDFKDFESLRSLPDNLTINGDLNIEGCIHLSSLPENLTVSGNFLLEKCPQIRETPKNLTVGGDLIMSECPLLTSIGEGLHVDGSLMVGKSETLFYRNHIFEDKEGCLNLSSISRNVYVGGMFNLWGCTKLTTVPNDLRVGVELVLFNCTGIRGLPEGLEVGEDLYLKNCINLEFLPENLQCHGNLNLEGCTRLTKLPKGLKVGNDLDLQEHISLTELPDDLEVGRDLNLEGCISLKTLPKGLKVGRKLILKGCTSLNALSGDLKVHNLDISKGCAVAEIPPTVLEITGNLDLRFCPNFASLPENLHIGGELKIKGCPRLKEIPKGLHVGGDLEVISDETIEKNKDSRGREIEGGPLWKNSLSNITKISENVVIGGSLFLRDCEKLRSLSKGLQIGESLILHLCYRIRSLPEDLKVGGGVNLAHSGIETLPSWILTLGPAFDGEPRFISLKGLKVDRELIDKIKTGTPEGPSSNSRYIFNGHIFSLPDENEELEDFYLSSKDREDVQILGLEKVLRPTQEDVKKAYKKLAIVHHPDKSKDDGKMFHKIQEAYERLMKTVDE